jgi:hypothetical protein
MVCGWISDFLYVLFVTMLEIAVPRIPGNLRKS